MRTDLRDRLDALAGHTPAASPPAGLWARGVRRRRMVRGGRAAVAAVLVALVGLGTWTWQQSRPVQPADTHGAPHVPDQIFYPVSPWTPRFDGPPGPLVTVFPTVRKTLWHTTNGIIGVTASGGTYGFLDLPGDAVQEETSGGPFALSPDGRRLALWVTGRSSGSPNTWIGDGHTITGVAVYDATTGQVREHHVATVHGLGPRALLWTDDTTLLVSYGQIQGGDGTELSSSDSFGATLAWDVTASGSLRVLASTPWPAHRVWGSLDGGFSRATTSELVAQDNSRRRWLLGDTRTPSRLGRFRTAQGSDLLVLSPDHRRAIGVPGENETGPLGIVRVPPGPGNATHSVAFHRLPLGGGWFRPLAWVDADHVAVLHRVVVRGPNGPAVLGQVDMVDLRTRTMRTLIASFGASHSFESDGWLANGLLDAPVVHATRPPSPPDLRNLAQWLGLFLGAVLSIGGLVLWGSRAGRA